MTSLPAPDRLLADSAWLRSLTRRLVGPELAADLEQDVAVAALRRPQAVAGRSWLAAVARNLAATLLRRQSAERRRIDARPPHEPVPSAAELVATAELQTKAVEAVLALPITYRDTVLLRFLQGLSLQATAQAMGVPEETVRTRQRRALSMLREQLAPPRPRRSAPALLTALVSWGSALKAKYVVVAIAVGLISLFAGSVWWRTSDTAPGVTPDPVNAASVPIGSGDAEQAGASRLPAPRSNTRTEAAGPAAAMPTTATLRVRVTWRNSSGAVPGMAVLCRPIDESGAFATTNEAGEAEFTALEPGRYRVQIHDWTSETVAVRAGQVHTIVLSVQHTKVARGIVIDHTGRPVAGAAILVSAGGTEPQWSFPAGVSDSNGRFDLAGLRNYALIGAHHPEHGTSDYRFLRGDPATGSEHAITLNLPGMQATVRGLVTDEQGAAIARAWVKIGEYGGRMRTDAEGNLFQPPPATLCTTDRDGRFVAFGLRTGDRQLSVYRRGLAPHREVVSLEDGKTHEVHVVLQRGAVLTGTVRTATGQPVVKASIESNSWEYPEQHEVYTDENGHFRYADLAPGERKFEAKATGLARQHRTFTLESGVVQQWDVVLDEGAKIHGRLADGDGTALSGWWIGLQPARCRIKTDDAGRFALAEAQPDGNTVLVRATWGFAPVIARFEDVHADTAERTFVIGPEHAATARIRGRVLDGDGAPLVGGEISLDQENWPVILGDGAIKSQADGSFEIGPLPPGRYRVTPSHGRWAFQPVNLQLESGTTLDLGALRGAPPARLTIELTGDSALVARARVELVANERHRDARGKGNRRTFDRVFPQRYELVVRVDDHECHRVQLSLDPGADLTRSLDVY